MLTTPVSFHRVLARGIIIHMPVHSHKYVNALNILMH